MASLINVRLNRGDASPWGFRLQGGKDFGTPLLIQKVNGNSLAEKAGLQVGDAVIKVNGTEVFNLRHKDAQDIIVRSGNNIEVTIQRGGVATWKPAITPVGSTPAPSSRLPSKPAPVTKTSLASTRPQGPSNIGTAHNLAPRPFSNPQVNGDPVKSIVNKQYNTPVNIYSEETIAETLSAQAEVLAGGVLGVNFKKNEKGYDAEKSEVFKMVQEAEREPKSPEPAEPEEAGVVVPPPISGLRHVSAPETKPTAPSTPGGGTGGQNICADCERLIVGVFVRIKDKNLHVECFKCATCGSSLKNVGYYSINNKLYCDVHAKMVARQNPPAPNLDPISAPPGGRAPAGTISAALAATTPSAGPQSPQPSTIAPVPFHAPRLGPSHVTPPKPVLQQQQSSPSVPATTAPKPFGSVSAPAAPFTPPAAPPAPAAPFYTKQQPELPPSDKFVWPPKQNDTQPAATATPLYIPSSLTPDTAPAKTSVPELTSPEDPLCCMDNKIRMSICSEEICELSEEKKKLLKSDKLTSLIEKSSDRPESPVPFSKQDSVGSTPKQELQSSEIPVQNLSVDERKESENSVLKNLKAESMQVSAQQCSSSSQNFEVTKEGGVTRTGKAKVEESVSHSSTSYSSIRSSKTMSRCITPEICEIMEKPRGSASILPPDLDRPATPQQVVVFPPDIPAFIPLPRSRASTPQPHALQRILAEELGLRPQQPPVPFEQLISEKDEPLKNSEELYTKAQVDDIVLKELQKYKNEEVKLTGALKPDEAKLQSDFYKNEDVSSDYSIESFKKKEEEKFIAQSTSITQQFESNKIEQSLVSSIEKGPESESFVKSEHHNKEQEDNKRSLPDSSLKLESQTLSSILNKVESPLQSPQAIIRPKPQLVSFPPETKPYAPLALPANDEATEKSTRLTRDEACQSPMVSALTVAPNRPYSPLPIPSFKPISLDDLPSPPEGSQVISFLSALTIAPDTPYSPFPEPVDVSKQSPPKFTKELLKSDSKEDSLQKSVSSSCSATSSKTGTAFSSSIVTNKFDSKGKNDSAFKPVAQKPVSQPQPLPLPLPETVKMSQSDLSKIFPPVSDELKRVFTTKSQNTTQASVSSTQNLLSSATSSLRASPFGMRKPDILPYYQQSIGEIPLAHRPQSPVPHTIKAPSVKSISEPKQTVSEPIKSNAGSEGSGYVSSSVFGQIFTATKQETKSFISSSSSSSFGSGSDKLLPYYQQNIGEIPLAHRPKSPVPHAIKAPSIEPVTPVRPASTPIKPSPLAGKAPETLSKSKQIFKPETKYQNVYAADSESVKPLHKTFPSDLNTDKRPGGVPWVVKKQSDFDEKKNSKKHPDPLPQSKVPFKIPDSASQPKVSLNIPDKIPQSKTPSKPLDFKKGAVPSQQPTSQTNYKPAAGFTLPSQTKPSGPPTTSIPPAGAGGPGNKGATFAGSTAPRRGRGTLNPNVGPGARTPCCGSCNRQIRGPFITALGKIWCPEHFMCANAQCRRPLQDIGFVEENTGLYCEYCFEQYLAPNCNKCGSKIKGDCLNAIGKHFHPECFCCAYCGKLFGNSPFFLEDALPYCENDWNELFTTKCFSCGFPIEAGDRWVEALSNNYHSQCFNCTMCKKNLEGQSFFAKGGRPFCKNHAR